uniref:Uncharacterized protein n=1 Tax=Oryza meridionalis TaxID=40149 RepID=A0A0E0DCB9_9ORYZ
MEDERTGVGEVERTGAGLQWKTSGREWRSACIDGLRWSSTCARRPMRNTRSQGDADLKLELACAEMPKEGLGNVSLKLELACAKLQESEA